MHSSLKKNLFLVKEHTGIFKAANNYDVLDPESGQTVIQCREEKLGPVTKVLRFTDFKRNTPFNIQLRTPTGEKVLRLVRGISFLRSTVDVFDENEKRIGGFKQKFFSIGGKFDVLNEQEQPVCSLKGKWSGWDFKFVGKDGSEYAQVKKKWAGMGKELFTSADNYALQIDSKVSQTDPLRQLIMAAVMCIDMVLKE